MDLDKIIDALVESTKQTIAFETDKIRKELLEDQRKIIINLTKSTVKRDIDIALVNIDKQLNDMKSTLADFKPENGKDGQDGKDGQSVSIEEVKEIANSWLAENIKQAQDGKDALQLDILPEINPSKSYPRGTYAQHDGGVFKSSRATDPIDGIEPHRAGWDVILRGVSSIELEQLDEKTLAIKSKMTGGTDHITKFSIPVMVYKKVWAQGTYTKGDTVTWGGSLWHCNETTESKPGDSAEWTLAAKRGRDGKDVQKEAPQAAKPVYLETK
jgi:hypothetical protein